MRADDPASEASTSLKEVSVFMRTETLTSECGDLGTFPSPSQMTCVTLDESPPPPWASFRYPRMRVWTKELFDYNPAL